MAQQDIDKYLKKYEKLWALGVTRTEDMKKIAHITINDQYRVYFDDELDVIYNTLNRDDIPLWVFDLVAELRKDLK